MGCLDKHKLVMGGNGDYKRGIHDGLIKDLEERLSKSSIDYDFIKHNIIYSRRKRTLGECDLWAQHTSPTGQVTHLYFEIKCNDSDKFYEKALRQLMFHQKNLSNGYRCFFFYVTHDKLKGVGQKDFDILKK